MLHALSTQALTAHGVDQQRVVIDELRQVFVAGGDHRAHAMRGGVARQGADHIVRLNALHHHQGPTKRTNSLMYGLNLRD